MDRKNKSKKQYNEEQVVHTQERSAQTITDSLLEHIGGIARSCGATAIFVYVDALVSNPISLPENLKQKVYYRESPNIGTLIIFSST